MPGRSPRVTVSLWSKDNNTANTILPESGGPSIEDPFTAHPPGLLYGGQIPRRQGTARFAGQDEEPDHRPSTEAPSPNQQAAFRQRGEINQEINEWLAQAQASLGQQGPSSPSLPEQHQAGVQTDIDDTDGISRDEISLGNETENRPIHGQTYYTGTGGDFTQQDREIIQRDRNWANAPILPNIEFTQNQPESSQAAIEKFERACRDVDSTVSRAATWGTRRRSLLSNSDVEGVTSGSFLKKLSLYRGDGRRPSILKELRDLVRKPSVSLKRIRAEQNEDDSGDNLAFEPPKQDTLAPVNRSSSWDRKPSVPSIVDTAFVVMGSNMASIGTTHARSGSLGHVPNNSPRNAGNHFFLKKPLGRFRSKSDLTGLSGIWKKTGGPPVVTMATTTFPLAGPSAGNGELEDEEDDEDDGDDASLRVDQHMIEEMTPNFAGFQQHLLSLNPLLSTSNSYLVDRIAHQQTIRYKGLLYARLKHLQQTSSGHCASESLCVALGGSARIPDMRRDPYSLEPCSLKVDSDGEAMPLEGGISRESFPVDIPMPPTGTLPAEFECQLCYQPKKFQKPSDWTKHVHEDVQPFTCTWDRCREPKMFKRKADWVRHENEGHRHLEWWTCDVDDCRHTCYRRDNFLQHLVREHKFPEPKVKTKAAIRRAGGLDPTWQKVESCHVPTQARPQNEPCRFCGRVFPTWKKLTVHLAKHMEQISLPVLRLVARRELEPDTIISPVQDPPPRSFPAAYSSTDSNIKRESSPFDHLPVGVPASMGGYARSGMGYPTVPPPPPRQHSAQQAAFMFSMAADNGFAQPLYASPVGGLSSAVGPGPMGVQPVAHGFSHLSPQTYDMTVTTGAYVANPSQYISVGPASDLEPFPAMNMDVLGLQNPSPMPAFPGMMAPSNVDTDLTQYTTRRGHSSSDSQNPGPGPGGGFM